MIFKTTIKNKYRKLVFKLSKNNHFLYQLAYRYFYYPSKGSLEHFADKFSRKNKGLTVVQVGANDGFTQDPIHKFIRRDGWRGVLLEPQKHVFERFLKPLHEKNPRIHTLNAAMAESDGNQTIYRVAFSEARWASGLTSFRKEVLDEAIDSGHIERCAQKEGIPLPEKREDYIAADTIEAISAENLLKRYNLTSVDWLQIDTEGFDFEIIKLFNIKKTQPAVIVFEHSHLSDSELKECRTYLTNHNYYHKAFGGNTLAVHTSEHEYKDYFS